MVSRFFTLLGLSISVAGIILLIAGSQALAVELPSFDDGSPEPVWLPASPHVRLLPKGHRTTGFTTWKNSKVHSCMDRLKLLRKRLVSARSSRDGHTAQMIEQDITQEKWRLDVAKDLSIKDYIILYVAPRLPARGAKRRLQEIARNMSREEVAQVLETYVQLLSPQQASRSAMHTQAFSNDR